MTNFTHLHCHSEFSPLDGLSSPEDMARRANENNQTHIAMTDHGAMGGFLRFKKATAAEGVKPIFGVEAYFVDDINEDSKDRKKERFHLTLLAENEQGIKTLFGLHRKAWMDGFYGKPRIDFDMLENANDGLIVLSGCLGGSISQAILDDDATRAGNLIERFDKIFGDNFFLEVQPWTMPEQVKVNTELKNLSSTYDIPIVGTIDCHYPSEKERGLEEVFLTVGQCSSFNDKQIQFARSKSTKAAKEVNHVDAMDEMWPDRRITFRDIDVYIMDTPTVVDEFAAAGFDSDVVERSQEIADRCTAEYKTFGNLLPSYTKDQSIPMDSGDYLELLCEQSMREHGFDGEYEYEKRLKTELDVINGKDFADYFLILHDICSFSDRSNIARGPARGSSGSSLVSYLMNITKLDPIKHGLLFFRFMNPERNDYPDIDIDFEDKRRGEIKDYISQRWGAENVASVSAYNMLHGKSAFKDVSRAYAIPFKEANKYTSQFDDIDKFSDPAFATKYPHIVPLAKRLDGIIRSPGLHAAGVVVADRPLDEVVPVESRSDKQSDTRIPAVAFDKNELEEVGLIKLDILGISMVSVIHDAIKKIKERHNLDVEELSLDIDDPDLIVFDEITSGNTVGVFQAEGEAFTNVVGDMGIKSFDDIVVANALIRPGSWTTQGDRYLACREGRAQPEYHDDILEPILKNTYGTWIFEEQLMQSLVDLAGFTWGQADSFRKIISKKRDAAEFLPYKQAFMDGVKKHVDDNTADELWHDIEAASTYMFNKAHSVAYALLAYQTAWLKVNYPTEFIWALLKNENDLTKVTTFLFEADRIGVELVPPDVNTSGKFFEMREGNKIQFGIANIMGVGDKAADEIVEKAPFGDFSEFENTTSRTKVKKHMIESMRQVGALECVNEGSSFEHDKYYAQLLNYPINLKDSEISHMVTDCGDVDEDEVAPQLVQGVVRETKKTDKWHRVTIEDATGITSSFAGLDDEVAKRQAITAIVSDSNLHYFCEPENVLQEEFVQFYDDALEGRLSFDKQEYFRQMGFYPDMVPSKRGQSPPNKTAAYLWSTTAFKTKKGAWMANAYILTAGGKFEKVVVFPQTYARKKHLLEKPFEWYFLHLTEPRGGGYALENMISVEAYENQHGTP